jgi:hypothetical protein
LDLAADETERWAAKYSCGEADPLSFSEELESRWVGRIHLDGIT